MNKPRRVAYYVSAHGYGHGVRSSDIIRELCRRCPDVQVIVTSDLPVSFLKNRLGTASVEFRRGAFDVGMVQLDSIKVDLAATLTALQELYARKSELVKAEEQFLADRSISLVVCDIPAIPIEAAKKVGIPAVAIGNFTWNWIYEDFAAADRRWNPFIREIEKDYGKADLLLRLPFAERMKAFRRIEDIPVVASPGRPRRDDLVRLTGCSPQKKWVLLSFTTLDWNEAALGNVESIENYEFFTVKPLEWKRRNIHPVDREKISFSDVLASVDVVISKPGFGLISECVVNRKPLVYSDRADFREYAILVESIDRYLRNQHIPSRELYAGDLKESLDAVWTRPEPKETVPAGGAAIAAKRIGEFLA